MFEWRRPAFQFHRLHFTPPSFSIWKTGAALSAAKFQLMSHWTPQPPLIPTEPAKLLADSKQAKSEHNERWIRDNLIWNNMFYCGWIRLPVQVHLAPRFSPAKPTIINVMLVGNICRICVFKSIILTINTAEVLKLFLDVIASPSNYTPVSDESVGISSRFRR